MLQGKALDILWWSILANQVNKDAFTNFRRLCSLSGKVHFLLIKAACRATKYEACQIFQLEHHPMHSWSTTNYSRNLQASHTIFRQWAMLSRFYVLCKNKTSWGVLFLPAEENIIRIVLTNVCTIWLKICLYLGLPKTVLEFGQWTPLDLLEKQALGLMI